MKKIISVLTLASLTFGVTFADVKFTTQYRTQAQAFSRVMSMAEKDGVKNGDENAKKELYNTYLLRQGKGTDDATDSLQFAASNDFAGITVQINPYAYSSKKAFDGGVAFKRYSAYIKLGSLSLNAGYWADGVMAGNYQLKNDADNTGLAGRDFIAYKLGSIYSASATKQVTDITSFAGTTAPSAYLEYKASTDFATLIARLSAISLSNRANNQYNDGGDIYSGIAAQLDAKLENWDFEFTFKQANIKKDEAERAVALYAQPLSWGNLKATFGGSLGFYEGDLTEYNAEARLRYTNGPLSFNFHSNISHLSVNAAKKTYKKDDKDTKKDYGQHVGAEYLAEGKKGAFVNNNVASTAMWNTIGLFYKATETFTPFITMGDIIGLRSYSITNGKTQNFGDYGVELFVEPGVQIFASKNAFITAACRIGMSNMLLDSDDHKDYGKEIAILVPVIMRVKL